MPIWPRRAFAITPIVIVLTFLLVGMVTWKLLYQRDLVPPSHPRAASIKGKLTRTALTTVLGSAAITAAVGAGCFFGFRRSPRAANTGMSLAMALPVTFLSIQAFRTMSGPPSGSTTTASSAPQTTTDQPTPSFGESMTQQLQRQAQRGPSQPLPISPPPASAPPTTQPPAPPATTEPVPQNTQPPPSPSPPPPRPTPSRSTEQSPSVIKAVDDVRADVKRQIGTTLEKLDPIFEMLAAPPKPDKGRLRIRIDQINKAREEVKALHDRLRDLSQEVRTAATNAGSDNPTSAAIKMINDFEAAERRFACDALARLLEQGEREAELLLTNFGLWKLGPDGIVDSKEFEVRSRAHSARFFIESALKTRDKHLTTLKGP